MIDIVDRGREIDQHDIAEMEDFLGHVFPSAYRAFLLCYNGGRPIPDIVDIDDLPGGIADVRIFLGIGDEVKTCNLDWNIEFLRERFPNDPMLPIARDTSGNLYCLDVCDSWKVLYCDLIENAAYKVSVDFESFLKKIRPLSASEQRLIDGALD